VNIKRLFTCERHEGNSSNLLPRLFISLSLLLFFRLERDFYFSGKSRQDFHCVIHTLQRPRESKLGILLKRLCQKSQRAYYAERFTASFSGHTVKSQLSTRTPTSLNQEVGESSFCVNWLGLLVCRKADIMPYAL
jgi:hypothetical protein